MKNTITTLGIFALLLSPPVIQAEEDGNNGANPRLRPTHNDIAKKQAEQRKKAPKITPSKEKPAITIKKRSLIASSTLLASNGHWTLVPRGAIIHTPAHLKTKIVSKPQGTLIDWNTFLRKNYGWIHVHAVQMSQAQGKKPIKPEAIKAYKSIGKMVIATCAGGPISVAPSAITPKDKEQEKKKDSTSPPK